MQAIAWRLSKVSLSADLFFRSSGDEFAFFTPNSGHESAFATANRIRDELKKPFDTESVAHQIGVSIGVAVMLSEDATVDKLLERADAAMYSAKDCKEQDAYAVVAWAPQL